MRREQVLWAHICEFFRVQIEAAETIGDNTHARFLASLVDGMRKRVLGELLATKGWRID